MPYLDITLADSDFQRTCTLAGDAELTIGRSPDCDVHIAHRSLSRQHCKVLPKDGAWQVVDCDSTNGTKLNDSQLMGPRTLNEGDIFKAGVLIATYHEHILSDNTYATTYPALDVPSAIARRSEAVESNEVLLETETHSVEMVNNDEITIDTDDAFIDIDAGNSLWDDDPGNSLWNEGPDGKEGKEGDSLWLD